MVSGPTPPGTGVMAEATPTAEAKSTSPTSRPSTTLMPTSTTTAPGLSIAPVTRPGWPAATTTMSARPTWPARSRVREWQTVTVASSLTSRNAAGMPTTADRPMTTASLPAISMPGAAQDLDRGVGRRRQEAVVAEAQEAGVERVDAVDVLGRVDGVDDRAQADRRRQRHLDDDAVDGGVVVELRGAVATTAASVASPSSSTKPASMPTLAQPRRICSR